LAAGAEAFFAVDLRGVGESQPNTCGPGDYFSLYGADYFYTSYQIMLGEPYVGRRTHDVLAVLDWLESFGYSRVHLAARGFGSLPAVFAALLDERIKQVTLKNAPLAFAEWAETEYMQWPVSSCLPRVLEKFDLPDCYRFLQGKKLRLIEPWDAEMRPLPAERAKAVARRWDIPARVVGR